MSNPNKLVVAISTTALYQLNEEKKKFRDKGEDAYYKHQIEHQNDILKPGVGFSLISKLLRLEKFNVEVEVIIASKNNVGTSLRVIHSNEHYGLDIKQSIWTTGEPLAKFLPMYNVDLFLSTNNDDVVEVLEQGIAAAHLLDYEVGETDNDECLTIAFDGDSVLFSNDSELVYKSEGLEGFTKHENNNKNVPMKDGPFMSLFRKLGEMQKLVGKSKLKTALITARSNHTLPRVITTLEQYGITPTYAFNMGGNSKEKILETMKADMYFDDQPVHLDPAVAKGIPVGMVVDDEVIKASERRKIESKNK